MLTPKNSGFTFGLHIAALTSFESNQLACATIRFRRTCTVIPAGCACEPGCLFLRSEKNQFVKTFQYSL